MASFVDRVIFLCSSGSSGSFIQASSVTGFQLMAAAGAVSGSTYRYGAQSTDLTQWEVGFGTWTSSNSQLTRNPFYTSSGSTLAVVFSAPPQVMITFLSTDVGTGGSASPADQGLIQSFYGGL